MSWKEDGSNQLHIEGNQVCLTGEGKSKANAIWSTGGTGYWEFKLQGETGIWLGVSNEENFGAGYSVKGLFYGGPGNLSDGRGLLRGDWGPKLNDNDVVGMKVEQKDGCTDVSFSHNGQGLGTAFAIEDWNGPVHPTVCLSKPGQSVTIVPGDLSAANTTDSRKPGPGPLGNWAGKFKLSITRGISDFKLSAKVENNYQTSVAEAADGTLTPNVVIGTKKLASPENQELEKEVAKFLEGLTRFRREGDKLIAESSAGNQEFGYAPPAPPAKKTDIFWMK